MKIIDLGLIEFKKAEELQRKTFFEVRSGECDSTILLCQHSPVITLGRLASKKNILVSETELRDKGIALYAADRGGDVTYHGPGQLIIYPIFNLNYFKKDIHYFLRKLEELSIKTLKEFGAFSHRVSGLTGVWIRNKKIASIGISIRQWITCHGLAINIKMDDLANFSLIRPCGMDIMMTSLESVLGKQIDIENVKKVLTGRLENDKGIFA